MMLFEPLGAFLIKPSASGDIYFRPKYDGTLVAKSFRGAFVQRWRYYRALRQPGDAACDSGRENFGLGADGGFWL